MRTAAQSVRPIFYKALAFLPRVCYTEFAKLTAYAKDQGVRFPVRGYIGLFSAY